MIKVMRFVARYWGIILMAIEFVETISDENTKGEAKKMMVLDAVLNTLEGAGIKPNRFTITLISSAIDMMVSVLNAVDWGDKLEPDEGHNLERNIKNAAKRALETQ